MPALPWFNLSTAEPDAQVVVMASRLPLRRYRDIPGFLRWTLRIRRQLATTPGVVGYSLDAHRLARTFWTVPAWTGQEAIEAFVATEPHRDAMAAIRPRMRQFRHSLVVHGDGRQRVISPQSVDGRHTSPSEAVWR